MRQHLAQQEVAGVPEEGQLVHVRRGEDVRAVIAGASVIGRWVTWVLESDVGVEAVSQIALRCLTQIAERLGEGIRGIKLQIGQAVYETRLQTVVVALPDGNSAGNTAVTHVRTVVVLVDRSGINAGIVLPCALRSGI